jgi:Holliday junction resolvase RusA-like endonuclease
MGKEGNQGPMTWITLTIDAPPSVNHVWRMGRGGRVYKDARYVAWQRGTGWQIKAKRLGRFPPGTKVAVTIRIGKAKRVRDIDNYGKGTLDLLAAIGIIDNDRNVTKLEMSVDKTVEPGKVAITIREMEAVAA